MSFVTSAVIVLAVAAVAVGLWTPAAQPVPNIAVRTQDDRPVRFYDDLVRGHVVVINFMFTTCTTLCPKATANLAKVQAQLGDHLGRDVLMLSVSVDPTIDTPLRLKAYADRYQARAGWYFLHASLDDVNHVRRRFRLLEPEDDDKDPTSHTGVLIYGNARRNIWRATSVLSKPALIAKEVLSLAG